MLSASCPVTVCRPQRSLRSRSESGTAPPDLIRLPAVKVFTSVSFDFAERLVDLYDLDFIAELSPAAKHVGVFLRAAAGFFGFPVAQEDVVVIAVAVEEVATVAFSGYDGGEFVERF